MTEDEKNVLLNDWRNAKLQLDSFKDIEMKLRQRIVLESGLFDPNKDEGTQTVQLGGGWQLKAVKKLNYKIENKEGQAFAVLARLTELSATQPELLDIAKNLFGFDANLRKQQFEKLRGDEKRLVEDILTITPASPSVELVPPKDK